MNFTIVKTLRCMTPSKVPIHRRNLNTLLVNLGVPKRHKANSCAGSKRQLPHHPTFQMLWDKFEEAKKLYLKKCWELYQKANEGFYQPLAELNAIWHQIKKLFARRGIGI